MHDYKNTMLTEAVERYIMGEMNPDERMHFENLRKADSEIDQMVVEHTLFLQKMNRFNEWQKFHQTLNEVHVNLSEQGKINSARLKGKAKVIYLYNKYKKVASIAAAIAGFTALIVSAIIWSVTPKTSPSEFELLKKNFNNLAYKSKLQDKEIHSLKQQGVNHKTEEIPYTNSGTGFAIDSRGFLVTNSHVIENARNIAVQNANGEEFVAEVVYNDPSKDIAILRIADNSFKKLPPIPYGFTKSKPELADRVFTLGYPREDNYIVYSEGYLSARTGYNGDTLSCQIGITANRGNSGSPMLNNQGVVIGILNGRQRDMENVAFAIQSNNIYSALSKLKKSGVDSLQSLKLSNKSSIAGLTPSQRAKKIQDYVFMVKVN
ncbi:MAG: serine protease [Niabella sp.]